MTHSGSGLGPNPAHSPSFNEYSSSGNMADVAARVVSEFAPDAYLYYDDDVLCQNDIVTFETKPENMEKQEEEEDDDDRSFEFPVPGRGVEFSPAAADEIFNDGQIRPLFPLFNTDLVFADTDWRDNFNFRSENRWDFPAVEKNCDSKSAEAVSIRMPLKKLMISERETSVTESASCSSSEADDLEGVAPETYCVWNPAKEEMRRKSKSTGSSKRWKIPDLLYRSNSDGGDAFVLKTRTERYVKSEVTGESDRKRPYSPYKQDPVGFFARMNGLSRTIQPF